MTGKIVLRKTDNLKEGDLFLSNNKLYKIEILVDNKLLAFGVGHDGVIKMKLNFISDLQQFYIEYVDIESLKQGYEFPLGVNPESLPLSFDDYSEAIKMGVNKEVEFETEIVKDKSKYSSAVHSFARLVVKEEKNTPEHGPHECPNCNWQCTCDSKPCLCCEDEEDVIDYWVAKKELFEKEKKELNVAIIGMGESNWLPKAKERAKEQLDWELNKFAHHCLTNRIKFNDSNQIAQIIIDYLK